MSKVPWPVRLVTLLWGAILLGASLVWPVGWGYDEPQHLDMAYVYSQHPLHFYGPGELLPTAASRGIQRWVAEAGRRPANLSKASIPARPDRPSLAQLGGPAIGTTGMPNQMVQHPPLAYWYYAAVMHLPGLDHIAWDKAVWILRLAGSLLVLPVPLLVWGAARRLLSLDGWRGRRREWLALAASVIPLTIPNLPRVCASVSNDGMLIAASSVLLYLLARVMTGDLRKRTAAGVAAALLAALLTKGLALVFPPVVLGAYLVGALRGSRASGGIDAAGAVRRLWPPLLVAAVGGVVGGVWWLRNLLVFGTVQTTGYGDRFVRQHWGVRGDADDGRFRDWIWAWTDGFIDRLWGGIGLGDTLSAAPVIAYGWATLAIIGAVCAVTVRGRTPGAAARWWPTLPLATVLATMAVVGVGSYELWTRKALGPSAAQGRYVYHLVVAFAPLVVAGWARVLRPALIARLPTVLLVAGLATQALSWATVLRKWYAGGGSLLTGFRGLLRWAPVESWVTVPLVVALPLLTGLAAVAVLALTSARRPAPAVRG